MAGNRSLGPTRLAALVLEPTFHRNAPTKTPELTARGLGLGIDPARIAAARRTLDRSGTNISEWASRHGFSAKLVHAILQGRRRCARGQSHRIAILLGLKDGELDDIDQRGGGSPVGRPA